MLRFTSSSIGEIVAQNYHVGKLRSPTSLFRCPVSEKAISAVRSSDGEGYHILYPNGLVYGFGDATTNVCPSPVGGPSIRPQAC